MVFRILLALLTLGILVAVVTSTIYFVEKVEKPRVERVREITQAAPPKPIDPGIREFDAALTLIRNRQLLAARDKLRYIIRYFPNSERHQVARELCSQISLDLLVSPLHTEGKSTYEVVRGDSLSGIAQKSGTTLEFLKRINGMTEFKIMPGDQLLVRALDFRVEIDSKRRRLLLQEGEEFFAEYPIRKITWPPKLSPPFTDSLRSKAAQLGELTLGSTQAGYDLARKELRLRKPRLSILSVEEATNSDSSSSVPGIFMDPEDLEELTMLLRVDSPIHVL